MFTVKQIVDNATSLYEIKEVNIGRPGSVQWAQAFEAADAIGLKSPCIIEQVFSTFSDEEMTEELQPEDTVWVEREGVNRADCIAVICSSLNSAAFPGIPEEGGIGYQFLYRGDRLYVMNSNGATIETVK